VDPHLEVVPAGQTVVHRLVAGAVVRGQVLDPGGVPVPNCILRVYEADLPRTRFAQADGAGSFSVALDPARHLPATLAVSAGTPEAPLEGRVVLEALPDGPVTIRLAPPSPVR
jgi:hypothetical protein